MDKKILAMMTACILFGAFGLSFGAIMLYNDITANQGGNLVHNTPPTIAGSIISPGIARTTAVLTAVAVGWSDPDGPWQAGVYRWFRNGTVITGRSGSTLAAPDFDKDDEIVVEITPFDGKDGGTPINSTPRVIENSEPAITGTVLSPANPIANETLSASAIGWSDDDGDPAGYYYRWFKNGNMISSCTASSLTPDRFNGGDDVVVEITPFDGTTNGTAVNSSTVNIGVVIQPNQPPSITGCTLVPATAYCTSILSATPVGWNDTDGDPAGYRYRWFRNGAAVAGQVGNTLAPGAFVRGDVIVVEATPFDGRVAGTAKNSTALVILNTPPTFSSSSISPSNPNSTSTLFAVGSGWSDADGDAAGYTYRWFKNGAEMPGKISGTLIQENFEAMDVIFVEITSHDGMDPGFALNSSAVVIEHPTVPLTGGFSIPTFSGNELFVSPSGVDDTSHGNQTHPCLTISYGLVRAVATGRNIIAVASGGVYAEVITLVDGISIQGGYNPEFTLVSPEFMRPVIRSNVARWAVYGASIVHPTSVSALTVYGPIRTSSSENSYCIYLEECNASLSITNCTLYGGRAGKGSDGTSGTNGWSGYNGSPGLGTKVYVDSGTTGGAGGGGGGGIARAGGAGGNATRPLGDGLHVYDDEIFGLPGQPGQDGGGEGGHTEGYKYGGYAGEMMDASTIL
ncbi:MAG: hypothetical protein JW839_12410, partial [Candidatus Lokiarchaeota archaeon]|nr:hypothetical protein [Candidatus Lokiarchaeota archaeon]